MSSVQVLSLLMIECSYMTALNDLSYLSKVFHTYEMSKCLPLKMLCHIDGIRMFLSRWTYHNVMTLLRKYLICQNPPKTSTTFLICKLLLYGMPF